MTTKISSTQFESYAVKKDIILRDKLKTVIHSTHFCCLCFEENVPLSDLDSDLTILFNEGVHLTTIRCVLNCLFPEEIDLASDFTCEKCKESSINAFTFIKYTKLSLQTLSSYVKELTEKTQFNSLTRNLNEYENTIVVLDGPKYEDGSSMYECDYCGAIYKEKKHLSYHIRKYHMLSDDTRCQHCQDTSCVHMEYYEYAALNGGKSNFPCADCDYKALTKEGLLRHLNKEHMPMFILTCELCNEKLYSRRNYFNHKQIHEKRDNATTITKKRKRKNVKTNKVNKFKCDGCPRAYPTEQKLKNHIKIHSYIHKCDMCTKTYQTMYGLEKHRASHTEPRKKRQYNCFLCNIKFKTMTEQTDHHLELHKNNLPCPKCDLVFTDSSKFNTHMHQNHKNRILDCKYCDYVTHTEYEIESHINKEHLKIAPYKCKICEKCFTGYNMLRMHLKTHIPKEKKGHACNICGLFFSAMPGLRKHMHMIHLGSINHTCEECGEGFYSAAQLARHKVRKHGQKTVECPICMNLYYSAYDIRIHIKKVHWKSDMPFDISKFEGGKYADVIKELFRDKRKVVYE